MTTKKSLNDKKIKSFFLNNLTFILHICCLLIFVIIIIVVNKLYRNIFYKNKKSQGY